MSDITKLPKWAQNEITRLRADLKSAIEKIDTMAGVLTANTNTCIISGLDEKPLPTDTCVKFIVPNKGSATVMVRQGVIYVNADTWSARKAMAIRPEAGNSFYIDFYDPK